MLSKSKPSFWSLTGRRDTSAHDEQLDVQTAPEVSDRLGSLMTQIDAGIAQSIERERAIQAGRKRAMAEAQASAETPVEAAPAAVTTPVAAVPPAAVAAPVAVSPVPTEAPNVEQSTIPRPAAEPEIAEVDPATTEALRIIAEQRKAAEALLQEACALEERIKKEAVVAAVLRAYQTAEQKVESASAKAKAAAAAEQEARTRAEGTLRDHSVLANELKSIESVYDAKRAEADAAKAIAAQLEQQLSEAQHKVQTLMADVQIHESRKRECLTRETASARAAAEHAARAAARKAEREAAEAEVQAALERANALKAQLPSEHDAGAIENVQRLATRIAQQAQLTRNSHNGTATVK